MNVVSEKLLLMFFICYQCRLKNLRGFQDFFFFLSSHVTLEGLDLESSFGSYDIGIYLILFFSDLKTALKFH